MHLDAGVAEHPRGLAERRARGADVIDEQEALLQQLLAYPEAPGHRRGSQGAVGAEAERRVEAPPDRGAPVSEARPRAARDPSRYVDRLDWGVLGNLVRWTRVTDGDDERWRLTLLWLIDLGDDEP